MFFLVSQQKREGNLRPIGVSIKEPHITILTIGNMTFIFGGTLDFRYFKL